jgi:excinuclease UvrABC nuclease subunit
MFTVERSLLPITPGIYLFKDQENAFLYIGKAKNLKKESSRILLIGKLIGN